MRRKKDNSIDQLGSYEMSKGEGEKRRKTREVEKKKKKNQGKKGEKCIFVRREGREERKRIIIT